MIVNQDNLLSHIYPLFDYLLNLFKIFNNNQGHHNTVNHRVGNWEKVCNFWSCNSIKIRLYLDINAECLLLRKALLNTWFEYHRFGKRKETCKGKKSK